jgi:hypothetical protein
MSLFFILHVSGVQVYAQTTDVYVRLCTEIHVSGYFLTDCLLTFQLFRFLLQILKQRTSITFM